jgi:hypothetical protein
MVISLYDIDLLSISSLGIVCLAPTEFSFGFICPSSLFQIMPARLLSTLKSLRCGSVRSLL